MTIGLMIECLVAVLLVTTIGYCVVLNRRLGRLRDDEGALRDTIAELVTATQNAERAIAELRGTAAETERSLAIRLGEAQGVRAALAQEVLSGETVLKRIVQIIEGARKAGMGSTPTEVVVSDSATPRERVPFHRARGAAA